MHMHRKENYKMTLKFYVKNQKLILGKSDDDVVAGSKNYLKAKFYFSSHWHSRRKTAVFSLIDRGKVYHVLLEDDNSCSVPWEMINEEGFIVSVFAGDLINSTEVVVNVLPSGIIDGLTPPEPTEDIYNQILEKFDESVSHIEDIASNVNANIKEHKTATSLDHPDNSVKTKHIDDYAITEDKLSLNAVTEHKLGEKAVTSSKIPSNAILTEHIKNRNVTYDKMAYEAIGYHHLDKELKEQVSPKERIQFVISGSNFDEMIGNKWNEIPSSIYGVFSVINVGEPTSFVMTSIDQDTGYNFNMEIQPGHEYLCMIVKFSDLIDRAHGEIIVLAVDNDTSIESMQTKTTDNNTDLDTLTMSGSYSVQRTATSIAGDLHYPFTLSDSKNYDDIYSGVLMVQETESSIKQIFFTEDTNGVKGIHSDPPAQIFLRTVGESKWAPVFKEGGYVNNIHADKTWEIYKNNFASIGLGWSCICGVSSLYGELKNAPPDETTDFDGHITYLVIGGESSMDYNAKIAINIASGNTYVRTFNGGESDGWKQLGLPQNGGVTLNMLSEDVKLAIATGEIEYTPRIYNTEGVYSYLFIDFLRPVKSFSVGQFNDSVIMYGNTELKATAIERVSVNTYKIYVNMMSQNTGIAVAANAKNSLTFVDGDGVGYFSAVFEVDGLSIPLSKYIYEGKQIPNNYLHASESAAAALLQNDTFTYADTAAQPEHTFAGSDSASVLIYEEG